MHPSPPPSLRQPTVTDAPLTKPQALLLRRLTELGQSLTRGRFTVTGNRETGHVRIRPTDAASERLLWSIKAPTDARCFTHPTVALFNRYRTLFPLTLTPDYSEDADWRAAQLNNLLRGFRDAFQSPEHQQVLAHYDREQRGTHRLET